MNWMTLALDIIIGVCVLLLILHPKLRKGLMNAIKGNKKKGK